MPGEPAGNRYIELKLVSDGTPGGTRILDPEGRIIRHVTGIRWELQADGLATAELKIMKLPAEISGRFNEIG